MSCSNTPATGSNLRVCLDFESCFNTNPDVADAVIIPASSLDAKVDQPPQQSSALRSGRHSSLPFYGDKVISGTLSGPVGEESIGFILKAFLGTPASDANVHTFTIDSTAPTFIITKEFSDIEKYETFSGCYATTLSFSLNNNNELLYNLGFIAAESTLSTSPYDESPEDMSDENFYSNPDIASGGIEEGGSSTDIFDEITINLNNNPSMIYTLSGAGVGTYGTAGKLETSGTISGVFTDTNLIDKGIAHTESSLDVTLTRSTYYLRFLIPELQWSQNTPAVSGPDIVMLSLNFLGYYQDSSEGSDIYIVLKNGRASY